MGTTNLPFFLKAVYDISRDDNVINNLSNIKIALSALNYNQIKYTSANVNLTNIFDCLNSSKKEQIDVTCEVLKTFLNVLDPVAIIDQHRISLLRALKHPNVEVKELVLLELNRAAAEPKLTHRLCQESDLLLCVVECTGHENNRVARPSVQFLITLGSTPEGTSALFSPALLGALNKVAQSNDINRFRVYEIMIEISAVFQPGLEASKASGLLDTMLAEVKNDDILATLNILELVTKLALTHHGFQYLESKGVVRHFADKLCCKDGEPSLTFLLLGLVKFFGNVAQLRPQETFQDYPEVMVAIFTSVLESNDHNVVLVALETLGYIATTPHGKWALYKKGAYMKEIMNKVVEIVFKWPTDIKVRGLCALANLLRLKVSEQDTEMLAVVKGWFDYLGPTDQVMSRMGEMAQQPFPEIQLAVLMLLEVLSEQPWSQQYIHNTPGLLELLLDRNSDSTMQVKNARFEVIKNLAESPTSEAVFGEVMVKQLKRFTKEGAVYVQLQTEVAIEKAD